MFKKDLNQLTDAEYRQFNIEYEANKSKLPYDLHGVNFTKKFDEKKN